MLAIGITAAIGVIQFTGGLVTGSLALLADTGHVLSDLVALSIALGAAWLAAKPASAQRTFGFRRAEVLAALLNGASLLAIAAFIGWEAILRLRSPADVPGLPVLVIASVGLCANYLTLRVLGHGHGINERAARFHVLGDMLGSVGVIGAALAIIVFDWQVADPVLGIVISLIVLRSAWQLVRESVDVLLLAAPRSVDVAAISRAMLGCPGVQAVHDLHVWTVSSGFTSLSGHVTIVGTAEPCDVLAALGDLLRDRFDIEHTTLQLEHRDAQAVIHPGCDPCLDETVPVEAGALVR